ncbi:hypothetical protein [Nocardia brasiliensis]
MMSIAAQPALASARMHPANIGQVAVPVGGRPVASQIAMPTNVSSTMTCPLLAVPHRLVAVSIDAPDPNIGLFSVKICSGHSSRENTDGPFRCVAPRASIDGFVSPLLEARSSWSVAVSQVEVASEDLQIVSAVAPAIVSCDVREFAVAVGRRPLGRVGKERGEVGDGPGPLLRRTQRATSPQMLALSDEAPYVCHVRMSGGHARLPMAGKPDRSSVAKRALD